MNGEEADNGQVQVDQDHKEDDDNPLATDQSDDDSLE